MKILSNKRVSLLLLNVFLMLVAASFAQAQTYESWAEKRVGEIRAEVAAINKGAAKYKKTTKNVEGVSLEGTEATYYRSAGKLQKITAEMYGETYNATGEFYYQNGNLLFAFVKRNQYDGRIGGDAPPKVSSVEEQRFYFAADGHLIRLLVGKAEIKSGDERYDELKSEIADISEKLKNA